MGFTEAQAEAVTSVVKMTRATDAQGLATKLDLQSVKLDLQVVKGELDARIANLEASLLRWVLGAIGFQTVIILGAVLALAKLHP